METNRILLRPWLESDAEALYKYASDPVVGERAGWPPHKSVEESLEIIQTVFHNDTMWAIVLKETNEAIGAMGYMPDCPLNLPAREGEPLVGYWIGKPYWNQGICTEALQLMIEHIRKETDYTSLISSHFVDNPASGRVMEKCGFIATGETAIDESLDSGDNRVLRVLRLELMKPRFRFNTIALFTTDNTKMVDFYCDVLGFETKWNGLDIDVEMHLGDMRILLFPRESIEKMTSQKFTYPSGINGTMEVSFDVPTFADVDKEYKRAVGMGAKPIMKPTTEPWGQRTCYIADPEGNLIEISSFNEK
ncbi:MAG: GNAT family N-acetyltransferase [Prevotellaceae bacterium]|nr:GNAT family N-acetyltransferase [Prevotellaceae bacterium]